MNTQKYSKNEYMEMDSMHDALATQILLQDQTLTVVYDNLDEGVLGADGLPYYKYKRLVINYDFDSFCDAKCFRSKDRYEIVDLAGHKRHFDRLTNHCVFGAYKYSVDSFGEITLYFDIKKLRNGKCSRNKYWSVEISMDAKEITYHWE